MIAERVRWAVGAFKADLMGAVSFRELDIESLVQRDAAVVADIGLDHRARNAVRIELVVPSRVKRVGPVHAFAVTTDLDHLRTAAVVAAARMRRLARDTPDMHGAGNLRVYGVGHVVLT